MPILHDKKSRGAAAGVCTRVLVADSDEGYRQWLVNACNEWGYDPTGVEDYESLVNELDCSEDSIVILDADFHPAGCLAALGQLHLDGFGPRVIFVSNDQSSETGERALKMGATAYINGSSDLQLLKKTLVAVQNSAPSRTNCSWPLLGRSPAMKELREMIRNVAASDASVMIIGESGTGKELVARAIHDCSPRASQEFVPVNMAALPGSLIESVLFGHEKGAFTGADQRQGGICEYAHEGTLFLDEIGEMDRDLQPKLLRFLQSYTVQRIGSTRFQKVDARIISATNRNVQELVQSGLLREDLYFRLHVIPIHVPPLRERKEDIPLLANCFLRRKCRQMYRNLSLSPELLDRLTEYSWPGNIRQLENFIERIVVMAKGDVIGLEALPPEWFSGSVTEGAMQKRSTQFVADLDEPIIVKDRQLTRMESAERQIIIEALGRNEGVVSATARFLGLGPATIYRKIRSLEIPKNLVRNSK